MNKFKVVLWVIILGIIALVIFQNQTFFLGSESLRINPWVVPEYQTPPIPIAIIVLIFFIFGLLLSYIFGVPERLRNRKAIKRLNVTTASQKDEIDKLQNELAALKTATIPAAVDADKSTPVDSKSGGSTENSNRQTEVPKN